MSKISLAPDASGTGIFTIASPNSNTNRTLTLPDDTGTLALTSAALTGTTDSATPFETALGTDAGAVNTGVNNVFVGFEAGKANTTGTNNTAVGFRALDVNTTGIFNTAVGATALGSTTTGTRNTAVGESALALNTTGQYNTAIGRAALETNSTASNNTAVGFEALNSNTTGANNTAVGYQALVANTTGANNTAVGYAALDANTTASGNTSIGFGSLTAVTTGANNTALGWAAGEALVTGNNNMLLGYQAGTGASPGGNVTGSNIIVLGNNSITDLYCADTTISSSDARDKTDVQDFTHGLDWVTQLRPVTYRWDKRSWYAGEKPTAEDVINAQPDGSKKRTRINLGFLAQEEIAVEQQFGFGNSREDMLVASENEDGSAYGLKYERLVPVLVNAIKELKAEVDALKSQINGA
jgi:trimeric autotransporter adhesin